MNRTSFWHPSCEPFWNRARPTQYRLSRASQQFNKHPVESASIRELFSSSLFSAALGFALDSAMGFSKVDRGHACAHGFGAGSSVREKSRRSGTHRMEPTVEQTLSRASFQSTSPQSIESKPSADRASLQSSKPSVDQAFSRVSLQPSKPSVDQAFGRASLQSSQPSLERIFCRQSLQPSQPLIEQALSPSCQPS
jgi:hypothetical protein